MTASSSISDILSSFLPALEHFRMLGYWAALAAALFETTVGIGLILPGSTIVLFLGFVAAQGTLDIGDLIWFAAIGAMLGDNINYILGKKYGERWFREGVWFLSRDHFIKARTLFDSHGGKSVFLGRFIPGIKEIVPLVAGLVRMNRTRFFVWNILGAIGWSLEFLLTGYLVGHSLQLARLWISRIGFFILVLLAAIILLTLLRQWIIGQGRVILTFMGSVLASVKSAIQENQEVGRLVQAHPAAFRFLAQRLDRERLSGLPLTILAAVMLCVIFLFGGVVEDLITSDPIVAADVRTAHLLAVFRTQDLTQFFTFVTVLGKWQVVVVLVAAVLASLWLLGKRSYTLPLVLSILLSESFTALIKIAFHRPRPDVMLYMEHSYSFPSGHATIAVSLYGFLTYILVRSASTWKARANYLTAGLAVVFLIGFSRLYIGEHYLSDVWGGYLIGMLGLATAIGVREWMESTREGLKDRASSRRKNLLALGITAAAVAFYAGFALLYQLPLAPKTSSPKIPIQQLEHIFQDERLKFSETIAGEKNLPIGLVLAALDDKQLADIFSRAGWKKADAATPVRLFKMEIAMTKDGPDPTAPVSPSFWNSHVNAFGFEKAVGNSVRNRYRARVWRTPYEYGSGKSVYVGTVCMDQGRKWLFTHRMNPDIDKAQAVLIQDLKKNNPVLAVKKENLAGKTMGENFTGDPYFSDGLIYMLVF